MPELSPWTWGGHAWQTIETFVVNYENRPPEKCVAWVELLAYMLPCGRCRENWPKVLQKYPLQKYMESQESRQRWFDLVRADVAAHEVKPPYRKLRLGMIALVVLILFLTILVVWKM